MYAAIQPSHPIQIGQRTLCYVRTCICIHNQTRTHAANTRSSTHARTHEAHNYYFGSPKSSASSFSPVLLYILWFILRWLLLLMMVLLMVAVVSFVCVATVYILSNRYESVYSLNPLIFFSPHFIFSFAVWVWCVHTRQAQYQPNVLTT